MVMSSVEACELASWPIHNVVCNGMRMVLEMRAELWHMLEHEV